MFKLSKSELTCLRAKLQDANFNATVALEARRGCPNCNGQCKNGCGVTCVAIFS